MWYIRKCVKENQPPLKMDNIDLKKCILHYKWITLLLIKLKAHAKQRGIKGYHKLRKPELIHKMEAHPDVNQQVVIPWLEIPRNTTRSVNTSAILDEPILDNNTSVLQPTPKFIAKSMQNIKDGWQRSQFIKNLL